MGPLANANEKYLHNENVYWDDLLKHPNYDTFWQTRAETPHMNHVKPAVLWVGGWFDAEDLSGPLKLFYATEKNGPPARRPRRVGFGTRLIDLVIQRQLNGEVTRTFSGKGLAVKMLVPLTHERWPTPAAAPADTSERP